MESHVSITGGDHSKPPVKVVRVHGRGGLGSRGRAQADQTSQPKHSAPLRPASLRQRLSNLHLNSIIDIGRDQPESSTSSHGPSSSSSSALENPASLTAIRESMRSPTPVHTIRFSGRGGAGSQIRAVPPQPGAPTVPDMASSPRSHNRSASSSTLHHTHPSALQASSPSANAPVVRLSGRGGAGSRPRQFKPKAPKSDERKLDLLKTWKSRHKGKGKEKASSVHSASTDGSIHNFPITPPTRVGSPVYGHIGFVPSTVRVIPPAHDVPVRSLALAAQSLESQATVNPSQEPDFQFYTTMRTYGSGPAIFNLPLEVLVTTTSTTISELVRTDAGALPRISISAPDLQPPPSPSSIYPPSLPSVYSDMTSVSGLTIEESSLEETWIENLYEPNTRPISTIVFSDPIDMNSTPETPKFPSYRDSELSAIDVHSESDDDDIRFASPAAEVVSKSSLAYAFAPYATAEESLLRTTETDETSLAPTESALLFATSNTPTPISSMSTSTLDLTYG